MITAQKSQWFESLFLAYTRNLFWRRFHELKITGLENLRTRDKNLPLVLYANHSSWWDPLVAFVISQNAGLDAFAMMEEKNLRRLKFFRRIGAFSVIRENPREAVKSIRYAVELLKEKPNRAVWVFPQGEIQPNSIRPLKFYNGAAKIIQQTSKCLAAPIAMRYEFLENFKPVAFAHVGEAKFYEGIINVKDLTSHMEESLMMLLENLR
ncbi:MAG: lysophospholipid acyltransferase family protein [Pyrinomonadaceae bacterium]